MSTASLPATADPSPGPHHVAIIMDGNGRWAKARGLPRVAGHRRGADAVRRVVRGAGELGIPVLTLFAFSTENWTRPADEVNDLMGLLRHYLRNELAKLAHKYAELGRVAVRNVRRDGMEALKKAEKDHKISQDEHRQKSDEVQKLTDRYVKQVDEVLAHKEKEIKTV